MLSSPSRAAIEINYPPLPESGPPEESDAAQMNFTERERLTKSWRIRLFSKGRPGLTLLEKRRTIGLSDSESSGSSTSLDTAHEPFATTGTTREPGPSQRSESFASGRSLDAGRISLTEPDEHDPTQEEHLYRWAMVYENQRGISLFSTRRYSSQSLLPRDPPAFSIVSLASSVVNGRPIRKSFQPDLSLDDFPLPDGNWRWASKEWMIDMRDDTVQHDGFEYNWFFRSKGWRSKAGHLNAGAWVRRRRWLRLMERPPLSALQRGNGAVHVRKDSTVDTSADVELVWRGDEEDWVRLSRAMHELGRDGRKLEAWKAWIGSTRLNDSEKPPSHGVPRSMTEVLGAHVDDLLRSFIYPSSRIEFLQMITEGGLLSEAEVLSTSKSCPPFVDRSQLEEALSPKLRINSTIY